VWIFTEFLSWIKYYMFLSISYLTKMNLQPFKPTLITLLLLIKNTEVKIDFVSHLGIQLYATLRKFSLAMPTKMSLLHHGWSLKKIFMLLTTNYQFSWEKVQTWAKEIHCYNIFYHCLMGIRSSRSNLSCSQWSSEKFFLGYSSEAL
jgi:hypothetical protein